MSRAIRVVAMFLFSVMGISSLKAQSMYGDQAKVDVKVHYVHSLEEAVKLAKKQKKLIFFNCFADWATPCHSMNRLVFSDEEFGKFLNSNFVNLILDLSFKENIPIKDKYKVRAFAHYLVLDANGEVVHRIAGGSPLPGFKEKVERALDPKTSLVGMEKEYAKGERSAKFLRTYFDVVSDAGYSEVAEDIRSQYLAKVPKTELAKAENWKLFTGLVQDINSEWFSYLEKNKSLFIKNNGADKIKEFAAARYMRTLMPYFSSTVGYTDDFMETVMKGLKYFEVDPSHNAYVYYNLAYKRNRGTVSEFLPYLEEHIGKIHDTFATGIDISLKNMVNVTDKEKELITDYLSRRMTNIKGSSLQQYQTAIKEIKRENGIIFEQTEFAEALKKAKSENKLIFLDAYTTWCGPCKIMSQQVFTLDEVGSYFNTTFVNYKMDMESGEGPKWAKEFAIAAYPTFLLVDGDGKVVHKVTGARRADEFLRLIKLGTSPESAYATLKTAYIMGDRNPMFVSKYVEAMQNAGEISDPQSFIQTYYNSLSKEQKSDPDLWAIVEKFGNDIKSPLWRDLIANEKLVSELMQEPNFIAFIEKSYGLKLYRSISNNTRGEDYVLAKSDLSKIDLPKNSSLVNFMIVDSLVEKKDFDSLVSFYTSDVNTMSDKKGQLNLDLLWKYLISSCSKGQKDEILIYLKNQHATADAGAAKSYKTLLDALL